GISGGWLPEIPYEKHQLCAELALQTPSRAVFALRAPHKRQLHINGVMCSTTLLHTHQRHPHVHLVVKAESLDAPRLHIDKAMLREWRQDFARMMRDQGISANATPRAVRGHSKGAERDCHYRTRRRGSSFALRETLEGVARELAT